MFGIGMQELIIIAIIALIIVGPKKLPDLAKTLGKGLSEFRKATDGISEDIKQTMQNPETPEDSSVKEPPALEEPGKENANLASPDEAKNKS